MLEWIDAELARLGSERTGDPEEQRSTAWSHVLRVPTRDGAVWFKSVADPVRHEVAVTCALSDWAPDDVLAPHAADGERGFMLLPDGGATVRTAGAPPWADVLRRYARLQRSVAPRAAELAAFDRRPESLPEQYERILERRPEADRLRDARPAFEAACGRLASLLPATIDHGDFHDGNVFADGRIFDWCDATVAHPFFTAVIALQEEPDASRDAFLEPWEELAPPEALLAQLEDALWVGKVARALTWQEVIDRLGLETHAGFDPVSTWLLWFLGEEP